MNKPLAITAVALGLAAAAPIGSPLAHPVSVRIEAPEIGIRIGVPVPRVYVPAPAVFAAPPVYVAPPVYAPRQVFYGEPYYREPYYRTRYEAPYPRHHHRRWDERAGRWCD